MGCIYLGLDIVLVDKVLIFIMVLLLRLVYFIRIPHNLLLIIGMKEIRYKIPLKILRVDVINWDQIIIQPRDPWGTTWWLLFRIIITKKELGRFTFLFFHFTKRIFLLFLWLSWLFKWSVVFGLYNGCYEVSVSYVGDLEFIIRSFMSGLFLLYLLIRSCLSCFIFWRLRDAEVFRRLALLKRTLKRLFV